MNSQKFINKVSFFLSNTTTTKTKKCFDMSCDQHNEKAQKKKGYTRNEIYNM